MTETEYDTKNVTKKSDHSRWRMDNGRINRRKEKPVGHRSGTIDGHNKKDRGPDLKIACPIFEGKNHDDPDVHIQAFEQYAELKHIMEEEWGEYFPHTLKKAARKWYYHYPASKLQLYKKLKKAFILAYTDGRGNEDILCELDRIKQGKLSVRKYVQKIKELTRRVNEPPSEKRMRAFILAYTDGRGNEDILCELDRIKQGKLSLALKLEQQAKKEKSIHRGRFDTSTSETTETRRSNSSFSESLEDHRKKKKKGSWSKKIDDMSRRISEISGLRGSTGKTEKWCPKCRAKNHTTEECTQCNYYKAFGHEWTNYKIRIHHLKEGKDLSVIAFANMEPVATIIEQTQSANTNTSGYNGRGRGRGKEEMAKSTAIVSSSKGKEKATIGSIDSFIDANPWLYKEFHLAKQGQLKEYLQADDMYSDMQRLAALYTGVMQVANRWKLAQYHDRIKCALPKHPVVIQENDILVNYFELMPDPPALLYAMRMEEAKHPRFYPALYPPHTEPVDQLTYIQIVEQIGGWWETA
ncbi:hypothetical protein L7F22_061194 [Adiantum nelumboides]|nr:hypothetical protein [Adiantum nelumboides]